MLDDYKILQQEKEQERQRQRVVLFSSETFILDFVLFDANKMFSLRHS